MIYPAELSYFPDKPVLKETGAIMCNMGNVLMLKRFTLRQKDLTILPRTCIVTTFPAYPPIRAVFLTPLIDL